MNFYIIGKRLARLSPELAKRLSCPVMPVIDDPEFEYFDIISDVFNNFYDLDIKTLTDGWNDPKLLKYRFTALALNCYDPEVIYFPILRPRMRHGLRRAIANAMGEENNNKFTRSSVRAAFYQVHYETFAASVFQMTAVVKQKLEVHLRTKSYNLTEWQ